MAAGPVRSWSDPAEARAKAAECWPESQLAAGFDYLVRRAETGRIDPWRRPVVDGDSLAGLTADLGKQDEATPYAKLQPAVASAQLARRGGFGDRATRVESRRTHAQGEPVLLPHGQHQVPLSDEFFQLVRLDLITPKLHRCHGLNILSGFPADGRTRAAITPMKRRSETAQTEQDRRGRPSPNRPAGRKPTPRSPGGGSHWRCRG